MLQQKLDQPISAPSSPRHSISGDGSSVAAGDVATNLMQNIQVLKAEVSKLQAQLRATQTQRESFYLL
jgi:hypothetical protein